MDTNKDNCSSTNKVQVERLPPLENPLIVDVLAYQTCQMTTIDDIKNFRLVCKLWRDAIPEPWRSDFQIHRIYQHLNAIDQAIPDDVDAITLEELRDEPDVNILSKGIIEIYSWKPEESHFLVKAASEIEDQPLPQPQSLENWFWTTCGSILTNVTFTNCPFLGSFTVYSENFLKAVPNLKTLRVLNCEISGLAWEAILERYQNQREFFEHVNLKSFQLQLDASDEEFDHLWSPFQRSLPNLEHISVRRIKRAHASYQWACPLLRYWNVTGSMKTLTFAESGEFNELYKFSISHSVHHDTLLKLDWRVAPPSSLSGCKKLGSFPEIPYLRSRIVELHLWGEVFPNLCFLQEMKNVRILVWNTSEDKNDGSNCVETQYDMNSHSCHMKPNYPKLNEVYISSKIKMSDCYCDPPVERERAGRVFQLLEIGFKLP